MQGAELGTKGSHLADCAGRPYRLPALCTGDMHIDKASRQRCSGGKEGNCHMLQDHGHAVCVLESHLLFLLSFVVGL